MLLSDIGEGSEALFCLTPSPECCTNPNRGQWRSPSDSAFPTSTSSNIYFSRGNSFLSLNRMSDVTEPTGIFLCRIPRISGGPTENVHVGVYQNEDEGIIIIR